MSGDRPLAQCWHKPLHCINTGGGELVWLGFAARMETRRETERERRGTRTEQKRKEKKSEREREGGRERARSLRSTIETIHPTLPVLLQFLALSFLSNLSIRSPLFSFFHSLCGDAAVKERPEWISFSACASFLSPLHISRRPTSPSRGFASQGEGKGQKKKKKKKRSTFDLVEGSIDAVSP